VAGRVSELGQAAHGRGQDRLVAAERMQRHAAVQDAAIGQDHPVVSVDLGLQLRIRDMVPAQVDADAGVVARLSADPLRQGGVETGAEHRQRER